MVMPLLSPAAGKLIFQLPEGSILNSNDLIAQLELDSPDAVVAAEQFRGTFPELGPPQVSSHGVDHRFQQARTAAQMTLAGGSQCTTFLGLGHASIHLAGYASTRSTKINARSRQALPSRGCWCITAVMDVRPLTGCVRLCKLQCLPCMADMPQVAPRPLIKARYSSDWFQCLVSVALHSACYL